MAVPTSAATPPAPSTTTPSSSSSSAPRRASVSSRRISATVVKPLDAQQFTKHFQDASSNSTTTTPGDSLSTTTTTTQSMQQQHGTASSNAPLSSSSSSSAPSSRPNGILGSSTSTTTSSTRPNGTTPSTIPSSSTVTTPLAFDHTPSSSNVNTTSTTLRSRKLSLSTTTTNNVVQQQPSFASATSPNSAISSSSYTGGFPSPPLGYAHAPPPIVPSSTTTARSPRLPNEVGLGLMLDEDDSGSTSSVGSSTTTTTTTQGRAAANAREMLARLGLDGGAAGGNEESTTLLGVHDEPTRPRLGSRTTSVASIRNNNNNNNTNNGGKTVPPASTVTNSTGTSSPLLIFTGSPHPTQSGTSPIPSPRSFSPSPNRTSSPAHSAYNLPSTRPTPTSQPMSRPPSTTTAHSTGSVAMDRTVSGSKSRTSDVHSRHQSLTSACPPVTSSYAGTPDVGSSSTSPYTPGSPQKANQRSWKVYDWGSGSSKTTGSTTTSEKNGGGYSSDDDDRKGAKGGQGPSSAGQSPLSTLLALPTTLLSLLLSPLSSSSSSSSSNTNHHHSPNLNASTLPTSKTINKRAPLLLRLILISYLIFSIFFFSFHASGLVSSSPGGGSSGKRLRGRLGPRGEEQFVGGGAGGVGGGVGAQGMETDGKGHFVLDKVGNVGEWAQRMAEGVRWNRYGGSGEVDEEEVVVEVDGGGEGEEEKEVGWSTVKRVGALAAGDRRPADNPLTSLTHTYRFAKMHDKIHWDLHDEIVPFAFRATALAAPDDITACLYSNEAWLSALPSFVQAWQGPISLVFESAHSRTSADREILLDAISTLRGAEPLVRKYVDFHLVGTPSTMSERTLNKTRERMILNPLAQNYQTNLARFFAPTDMVFLVGDARVIPSIGLKKRLTNDETIRDLVLDRGDAIVVPSFGFVRDPTGDSTTAPIPTLHQHRSTLDLDPVGTWDGVSSTEFPLLAAAHLQSLHSSLPLTPSRWPLKKASLVSLVNTRLGTPDQPTNALLALFDRRWDLNHGPSNWYLWRKSSVDPRLLEDPISGGGVGLGVDEGVGGGNEVYKVVDYDLHYAPNVVVSKKGQPWCTERFETMPSACTYQMYLSGAEMWVLPDEWTFTLEVTERRPDGVKEDPAEKLKNSISSRLYGKFHQEACMHYGREFLSIKMWDSDKAQHLRETCARTLSTWGMGLVQQKK